MVRLLGLAFGQGLLGLGLLVEAIDDVEHRKNTQHPDPKDKKIGSVFLEGLLPVVVLEVFLEAHGLFLRLRLLFFNAGAQLLTHVRREVNDDIKGRDTETHTEAEDGVVQQVVFEIVASVVVHDIFSTVRRGLSYF